MSAERGGCKCLPLHPQRGGRPVRCVHLFAGPVSVAACMHTARNIGGFMRVDGGRGDPQNQCHGYSAWYLPAPAWPAGPYT
jgi:hypothetical protein